ncbi:hypothetical protein TNCV_5058821 [Trichonephila clavipes]|nr:hypothetical protein TNCV_5058821 [Trichonephila clavipes]
MVSKSFPFCLRVTGSSFLEHDCNNSNSKQVFFGGFFWNEGLLKELQCTIHGKKRCHGLQEVGLLPVGPRKVFYFPSTAHWKPMEAFPYPPSGDAPSSGYRLPRASIGETIAILSQDNFAIAYTDGSSDRSLSNGGAGIILLLPDGNNYKHKINTSIIASNFTSKLVAIREALILYQQDPHVIDSTEGLVIFSDSLNQL